MHRSKRLLWVTRIAAALVLTVASAASAQQWKPTKPITIIVPWAAGGSTDQVTRVTAAEIEKALGQKVIVVNQPGASGSIGTKNALEAAKDGYTWTAGAAQDLGTYAVLGMLDTKIGDWALFLNVANVSTLGVNPNTLAHWSWRLGRTGCRGGKARRSVAAAEPVRPVLRAVPDREETEPAPAPDSVRALNPLRSSRSSISPEQWFHIACELEEASPVEARHAYGEALEGDPDYADAHINLGRLHHEDGDLEDAERHYRSALRTAPDEFIGHFNLAVLLEDPGVQTCALPIYRRALEVDPDSADAHYNLGLLLESLGRRDDAMRHLMNARRLTRPAGRKRETT